MRFTGAIGAAAIGFVLFLTAVFGSWYTVDQGELAVTLRNGAVSGTAAPGLHFKVPIIDSIFRISTQTINRRYEKVATYSRDQQPAEIIISVNYRAAPSEVADIYARFGSLDGLATRLIDPRLYEHLKNVLGRFNAVTAIQERARLNSEIESELREAVAGPIVIESVQIENIDFSDAYEHSVEERMLAEVEVAKLQQNAEREKVQASIVVIQAKAQADAVKAKADAEAYATKINGDATAAAIKARAEALANNPALIQLTAAERWDGKLPSTMLPSSSVPFVNVPTSQ